MFEKIIVRKMPISHGEMEFVFQCDPWYSDITMLEGTLASLRLVAQNAREANIPVLFLIGDDCYDPPYDHQQFLDAVAPHPVVLVRTKENHGIGAFVNMGHTLALRFAPHGYYGRLDADVVLTDEEALSHAKEGFENIPDAYGIYSNIPLWTRRGWKGVEGNWHRTTSVGDLVFHRVETLRRIGVSDPNLQNHEENDIRLRCRMIGQYGYADRRITGKARASRMWFEHAENTVAYIRETKPWINPIKTKNNTYQLRLRPKLYDPEKAYIGPSSLARELLARLDEGENLTLSAT